MAYSDYNSNPLCNGGDAVIELIKTAHLTYRTAEEYLTGLMVAVWNCVNAGHDGDAFTECAVSITREMVPPKTIFDLMECQSGEIAYRLSALVASLLTPLVMSVYRYTEYPDDGYYFTTGVDNLQHVQAKPIEAAIATLLTSLAAPHWAVHVLSTAGKGVVDILLSMQGQQLSAALTAVLRFRYVIMSAIVRATVLFFRDLLVGAMELARAISTVVEYDEENSNPNLPDSSFTETQANIMTVVSMAQEFINLFADVFFQGLESFFKCLFLLVKGLMTADSETIKKFFVTLVNEMSSTFTMILNGVVDLLFQEGSPFAPLCKVLDGVQVALCTIVKQKWIPSGFEIHCDGLENGLSGATVNGADEEVDKCSWWPFNGVNLATGAGVISGGGSGGLGGAFPGFSEFQDLANNFAEPLGAFLGRRRRVVLASDEPRDDDDEGDEEGDDEFQVAMSEFSLREQTGARRRFLGSGADADPANLQRATKKSNRDTEKALKQITKESSKKNKNELAMVSNIGETAFDLATENKGRFPGILTSIGGNFNDIKNIGGSVNDIFKDVVNLPVNLLKNVASIIPTGFELQTKSISTLVWGGDGIDEANRELNCALNSYCPELYKEEETDDYEATVCTTTQHCEVENAMCVAADSTICPAFFEWDANGKLIDDGNVWAKACNCRSLSSTASSGWTADAENYPYFCNYASGFCTAGTSPFAAPLTDCSGAHGGNGLVYGEPGYDALCYVSPLWKCSHEADKELCRANLGWDQLEGPSLCRAFCDPTFENRNNRLTQYRSVEGGGAKPDGANCVCELGVDRVFASAAEFAEMKTSVDVLDYAPPPAPPPPPLPRSPPPPYQPNPPPLPPGFEGTRRRRKLFADEGNKPPGSQPGGGVYTACSTGAECAPTFEEPTLCRSLWNTPIPCYSCSERVYGPTAQRGYACSAATKTCDCSAPDTAAGNARALPDDVGWRGDSWCDNIMRAYRHAAVRSPLENAWVHRCNGLREFGAGFLSWVGLQSVPPDVFYNPWRLMYVLRDLAEGVYVYFSEKYYEHASPRAFFDRLLERRVEPLLVFKALDIGQKSMAIGTKLVSVIDPVGLTQSLLDSVHPAAAEHFAIGTSAVNGAVSGMMDIVRRSNASRAFGDVVTRTAEPVNVFMNILTAEARRAVVADPILVNDTDALVAPLTNISDPDAADVFYGVAVADTGSPRRRLLEIQFDCELIRNLKTRLSSVGSFLMDYYGTDGEYLAASMCAYETFTYALLNTFEAKISSNCAEPRGQNKFANSLREVDAFPGVRVRTTSPRDAANAVDAWFTGARSTRMSDIVKLTKSSTSSAISCDSDTLLCKNQKRSLFSSFAMAEIWIFTALAVVSLTGFNLLSISFFVGAQLTFLGPAVLFLAYGFSITCLPRLPVCLGDDIFAALLHVLPRHITWPENVVPNPTRSGNDAFVWFQTLSSDIVDCNAQGLSGFFDELFWARTFLRREGYLDVKEVWAVVEWPLVRFAPGARAASARWLEEGALTATVNECGALNALGAVPPLILSFFFYLSVSYSAVPFVRAAMKTFVGLLPVAQNTIIFLLGIYCNNNA